MLSQDLRRRFLHYFKIQSHRIIPSSPVIPKEDPNLLFTNAGMNQFKDVFLGKSKRDYSKAATSQKCIRVGGKHNDLDNVGHTSRHTTFFEMLGNFSFGDYFKKEAIDYAWDVSTNIFNLDPDKIWISIYKKDDEAAALWEKHVPATKIIRFGEDENFWAMGNVGPCGPCSELLLDRGEKYSDATSPIYDLSGERYLEFWNLVFMEFNRNADGTLSPLPKKCIDTGAGLERIAALKMKVDSLFLTDILKRLITKIEEIANKKYDPNNKDSTPAFHVIADHIRTLAFAIADGAQPSNVDRGYILRKILRRAIRYGKILNLTKPFLSQLVPTLVETMGEDFPELKAAENRICEIIEQEEEAFFRTLKRGGNLLNEIIEYSEKEISGEDAFKLKDTYGLPLEEILLLAKDAHLNVNLERFHELEEVAKEKSRQAQKIQAEEFDKNFFEDFTRTHKKCEFLGYSQTELEAKVIAIIVENTFVDTIEEGQKGTIILDKTPFYAERGGQVGDSGTINNGDNLFIVNDCQPPYTGVITHIGYLKRGKIKKQDKVHATINKEKRDLISNNHTATHLLHWALSQVLGEHIQQAGSVVDDKRLRFDFNHHQAMTFEQIRKTEDLINDKIRQNLPVSSYTISYEQAQKDPLIKQLFGEKYEEQVRVVDSGISKELCGGTHTSFLGTIGLVKIAKESSIAAGVRRIEAICGRLAEKHTHNLEDLLIYLSRILKTTTAKLPQRIDSLLSEKKELENRINNLKSSQLENIFSYLLTKVEKIKDIHTIIEKIDLPPDEIQKLADKLIWKIQPAIVAIATSSKERCQIIIKVSPDLVKKGFYADEICKSIAPIIEGGGGGRKESGQAGGTLPHKLPDALATIQKIIQEQC